ncbi:hypothetical protein PENTCL1PPCAC_17290, partial [Pristionchus entomophagus]
MNVISRFLNALNGKKVVLSPIESIPVLPLIKILSYLDENDFLHLKVTSRSMWKNVEETKLLIPRRTITYLCINIRVHDLRKFPHAIFSIRAHSGKKTVDWILTHAGILLTIRRSFTKRKRKSRLIMGPHERNFDSLLDRIVENSMVLGLRLEKDDLEFVIEYDNEVVEAKRVSLLI